MNPPSTRAASNQDALSGELVPLGSGPVATLFAGIDPLTGTGFALKVYPGRIDWRTKAALDAELGRQAGLRTLATVLVADRIVELADGRCAVWMQLCAQSLPELVSTTGTLSVPDVLALGYALATALGAAHSAGLVHSGLTPGNVLFRSSGEPVLSDFGATLRQAFPADTRRGSAFLAPETVRDGVRNQRTDLYGLGAVLHLALFGMPPRPSLQGLSSGGHTVTSGAGHLEAPAAALTELIRTLLAHQPDARPISASAVADRMTELVGPAQPQNQQTFDDFGAALRAPARWAGAPGQVTGAAPAPQQPAAPPPQSPPWPTPPLRPTPPGGATTPPAQSPQHPRYVWPEPRPAPQPPPPAAPQPGRQPLGHLVIEYLPKKRTRSKPEAGVLVAAVGALSVFAVAVTILFSRSSEPALLPTTEQATQQRQPAAVPARIVLNEPIDQRSQVELSWHSNQTLEFVVIVAQQDGTTDTTFARNNTRLSVPVDPAKPYCFLIQGTNGGPVVQSRPQAIRGARCPG